MNFTWVSHYGTHYTLVHLSTTQHAWNDVFTLNKALGNAKLKQLWDKHKNGVGGWVGERKQEINCTEGDVSTLYMDTVESQKGSNGYHVTENVALYNHSKNIQHDFI